MKFSEKEIQTFLWENKKDFVSLIEDLTDLEEIEISHELSNILPENILWNKVVAQLTENYERLEELEIFSIETPLTKSRDSTIRADFLGHFPGSPGIAIIELKKSEQTERQAFTELLAYSNHLSLIFPGLTKNDIVYILISPMKTRIAREAVIQSLAFDNKNIIALVPTLADDNDLSTLSLKTWVPTKLDFALLFSSAFNSNNLSVYKVVWEYSENEWNPSKGESLTCEMKRQLNNVSVFAAQKMEEQGIHGFVYTSQSFPELSEALPYSNSLVLVGLNPYAVGSTKYKLNQNPRRILENIFDGGLPNLSDLLPSLISEGAKKNFDEEFSILSDLYYTWSSQLFSIGSEVINFSTLRQDGSSTSIDQGSMTWDIYQKQIIEDVYCFNLDIRSTGLFKYLLLEVLKLDYKTISELDPKVRMSQETLLDPSINTLTSQFYVRDFINRMFDYNYSEEFENEINDESTLIEVEDPFL